MYNLTNIVNEDFFYLPSGGDMSLTNSAVNGLECIGKGKEHKKYEFDSKAAIVLTKTIGILVGVRSFSPPQLPAK
jgi:hypothetical protein